MRTEMTDTLAALRKVTGTRHRRIRKQAPTYPLPVPPYRTLYGRDNWYRKIPKRERETPRHKYMTMERVVIPWPEAPPWVEPFTLDDGLIRAFSAWIDIDGGDRLYLLDIEDGSFFDGASNPAIDRGAMLASLPHDTTYAAHRNGLLGDRTFRQSFRAKLAADRRYGRMIQEREAYLEEIGVELDGIEKIGRARNAWSRAGLFVGGWPAWRKRRRVSP